MRGSSCDLFEGKILTFIGRNWGKSRNVSVKLACFQIF